MMQLALLLAAALGSDPSGRHSSNAAGTTIAAPVTEAQSRFLTACAAQNVEVVRAMLEESPQLANLRRENDDSAVTIALFANKGEGFADPARNATLQAILAKRPNLDAYDLAAVGTERDLAARLAADPGLLTRRNRHGWTLAHVAAFGGNVATLQLLLDKGADPHVRAESRFRNTPLQTALLTGQLATAKLLLERGADPLIRQAQGFTPMHQAAGRGRQDLVDLLLAHGAELNSRADDGRTPLSDAIRRRHDELAAYLRSKGASVEPVPLNEAPKK